MVLAAVAGLLLTQAGHRTDAIIGGQRDDATRGVFQLFVDEGDGGARTCSAVLISPKLLLTAQHCVDAADGGLAFPYAVTADTDTASGASFASPLFVTIDPDRRSLDGVWVPGADDLAIVALREPVVGVLPFERVAVPRADWASAGSRSVGYGLTGLGRDDADVRRTVQMRLAAIDAVVVTAGTPEQGVCFGDSGGPLLLTGRDGKARVLGIASALLPEFPGFGAHSQCGPGTFARPTGAKDWVRTTAILFEGADTAPSCGKDDRCRFACDPARFPCRADVPACAEPDPDCLVTGTRCESHESCEGGECRVGRDGQGVCTKTCATAADCPGEVACTDGVCAVERTGCGCGSAGGAGSLLALGLPMARRRRSKKAR